MKTYKILLLYIILLANSTITYLPVHAKNGNSGRRSISNTPSKQISTRQIGSQTGLSAHRYGSRTRSEISQPSTEMRTGTGRFGPRPHRGEMRAQPISRGTQPGTNPHRNRPPQERGPRRGWREGSRYQYRRHPRRFHGNGHVIIGGMDTPIVWHHGRYGYWRNGAWVPAIWYNGGYGFWQGDIWTPIYWGDYPGYPEPMGVPVDPAQAAVGTAASIIGGTIAAATADEPYYY